MNAETGTRVGPDAISVAELQKVSESVMRGQYWQCSSRLGHPTTPHQREAKFSLPTMTLAEALAYPDPRARAVEALSQEVSEWFDHAAAELVTSNAEHLSRPYPRTTEEGISVFNAARSSPGSEWLINRQEVSFLVRCLSNHVDPVTLRADLLRGHVGWLFGMLIRTPDGRSTVEAVAPSTIVSIPPDVATIEFKLEQLEPGVLHATFLGSIEPKKVKVLYLESSYEPLAALTPNKKSAVQWWHDHKRILSRS